ncbi:unnamed protein product [Menidia menidia]|uniref:(Atlantic silverside) hypothetical protein n=1 Tax=Menidia menidia TaxID=238744 RepID=A0A8S4AVR3_9TELE|nr:unnamed protein product [Menidia menidia]
MEESGRKTQTEGWPLQMKYSAAAADLWADQGGVQPGFRKPSGQKPSQPALCRRADAMRRGSFTPERCHVSSLLTPKDPAESSLYVNRWCFTSKLENDPMRVPSPSIRAEPRAAQRVKVPMPNAGQSRRRLT